MGFFPPSSANLNLSEGSVSVVICERQFHTRRYEHQFHFQHFPITFV
jgi:hypothetical protein